MKAIEQYFPVVLFIMLYKVVLTFESVDEILKCDHTNESFWAVRFCGVVRFVSFFLSFVLFLTWKERIYLLTSESSQKMPSKNRAERIIEKIFNYKFQASANT